MAEASPTPAPEMQAPSHSSDDLSAIQHTFPLPLSPFEKYVLWDERPAQPMTSFIELHFESRLDPTLLADALATAVHRNPLLAARVAERQGELVWDYDQTYRPELRSDQIHPPLRDGWPVPIDLRRECGSRYWYGETERGSRLLIQLHHACSDGMGLRRVLIDALTGYARGIQHRQRASRAAEAAASAGPPSTGAPSAGAPSTGAPSAGAPSTGAPSTGAPSAKLFTHNPADSGAASQPEARWEQLSIESLGRRYDFSDSFSGPPTRKLTAWQRLKNAYYFHFQLPIALSGTPATAETLRASPAAEPLRHRLLDRDLSERITQRAREQEVGINDLAMALLFQTCAQWAARFPPGPGGGRIRILMPYDLRSRVDLRMPATNRLSFSFLGRDQRACHDVAELVASVQSEIREIKESRLPLDFLNGLALAVRRPAWMRWALGRSRRMATAVLTYTGDVSRGLKRYLPEQAGARLVGDARLCNILVAPPVREHTNIAIGLCVNWGQLCLSAAWNRAALSAEDCEEFLKQYADNWNAWLESAS